MESKGYAFGICFFELFVRQHFEKTRPQDPSSLRHLGLSGLIPAVDDHGPSIRMFSLFSVGFREEVEDIGWLLRDAMIGPANVLVVPDFSRLFCLQEVERDKKYVDTEIKSPGGSCMSAQCKNKQTNKKHTQRSLRVTLCIDVISKCRIL